jgi:acetylornithine/succinyldiaminopimelate/putrescine aminotransferase/predicted amino acid dehydrogenase
LLNPTLKDVLETFRLDKNYTYGRGSCLLDDEGIEYLDFIAQYGAVPFGYNPDFIWDQLEEVRKRSLPSLVQPSIPGEALKLANMLAECSPGDLSYCTFCQSGTEAVEAAIKLARSTTGKELIISTLNSFHGKTLGSLSATGKGSYQEPFRAPAPGFVKIPFNDLPALERVLQEQAENTAAFIVEPVQGEGGIITAQAGYLKGAQELCHKYGVIFIVDEIQTGLGRTGRLFACEHEGIEPDIMLLAKALGGGLLPIGVCISSPRVWNDEFGMLHSSTFANNQLSCSVGIAVLERLEQNDRELIGEVEAKGEYLLQRLRDIDARYPGVVKEIRGSGLMVGVEINELTDCGSFDMTYLADCEGFTALIAGFLLNIYNIRLAPYLNSSMTLRLEPTLTITYEEIDRTVEALELVFKILYYRDYSKLYRHLIGDYKKPEKIIDYRGVSRAIKSSFLESGERATEKFAFIIHYAAPEDVVLNNPSFVTYSRDEIYQLMEWQSKTKEAGLVCHMPAIRSLDGTLAEGWLIGVPFGAREIMSLPREETAEVIKQAVDMGRDLGAKIVGLGALSSVVTRGGRAVQGRGPAITSGNSFTVLMAMEALVLGAQKMHINLATAKGAVLGATGSIGRACALLLSEKMTNIVVLGNPDHVTSSKNRLASLMRDMYRKAVQRYQMGELEGLSKWVDETLRALAALNTREAQEYYKEMLEEKTIDSGLIEEICHYLNIPLPVSSSLEIKETLPHCSIIIATSNSPEFLVYPEDLRPGAVICDVARPADVAPECYTERNDVLILEGGLVQYPDTISFGPNLGYRDGVNVACLSETILLALEGDYNDYSIGSKMPLETIEYMRYLGAKHGFTLAGLKMGNQEICDKEVEEIYLNAQKKLEEAALS